MSSKKVKIEINKQGVAELLKSKEIEKAVKDQADAIAQRCGTGYASDTKMEPTRVIASAYTETYDAMRDDLKNNTLIKNIGGEYKKGKGYRGG